MYGATSLASHFPRSQTPRVTAGLKCPPEICPPAKIITMSAEPIASGAKGPAPWPMTVHPIVRTRKKVPINSATYFFINNLLRLPIAASSADSKVWLRLATQSPKTNLQRTRVWTFSWFSLPFRFDRGSFTNRSYFLLHFNGWERHIKDFLEKTDKC